MRALVLNTHLSFEAAYPEPKPASDQVLIRVCKAGICNTDIELIAGYMNYTGILGHEFVGEVVGGDDTWVGQRVVGEINVACHTCDFCQRGIPSQCRNRTTLGIDRHPGAFADFLTLANANLYRVPDNVSDTQAVFTEPLAAALQCTEAVHISPRDRVIVIGAGKLGLLCAQVVKLTGADIAVVVRREAPARVLNQWGIPAVSVSELPPQRAQVVIDCTGNADGFATALNLVEPRGTIILKSTYTGTPTADLSRIAVDEISVIGSRCGPFDSALRLLSHGLVDVESMVEAEYPLHQGLDAVEHAARPGVLKVLLNIARHAGAA